MNMLIANYRSLFLVMFGGPVPCRYEPRTIAGYHGNMRPKSIIINLHLQVQLRALWVSKHAIAHRCNRMNLLPIYTMRIMDLTARNNNVRVSFSHRAVTQMLQKETAGNCGLW